MSNEWYTRAPYIEAARRTMGAIDLDPASCQAANETVKATQYYDLAADGLAHEWHGRVFLNPPFGKINNKSVLGLFVEKLIDAYETGQVSQAVLLSTYRTDNKTLNKLWKYPICFSNHHITFDCPNGPKRSVQHFHGSVFVYMGPHVARFIEEFREIGTVARAVREPTICEIH